MTKTRQRARFRPDLDALSSRIAPTVFPLAPLSMYPICDPVGIRSSATTSTPRVSTTSDYAVPLSPTTLDC